MRSWIITIISSAAVHGAALAIGAGSDARTETKARPVDSVRLHIVETHPQATVATLAPKIKARPAPRQPAKAATHTMAQVPERPAAELPASRGAQPTLGTASMVPPKLIRDSVAEPDYSSDALQARFQGLLVVNVTVDEEGQVREARLTNPSGFRIDSGVLAAARKARYVAARGAGGAAVAAEAQLKFNFRIP